MTAGAAALPPGVVLTSAHTAPQDYLNTSRRGFRLPQQHSVHETCALRSRHSAGRSKGLPTCGSLRVLKEHSWSRRDSPIGAGKAGHMPLKMGNGRQRSMNPRTRVRVTARVCRVDR
eukprot:scaffold307_cov390-Prasinococcus_capsulatus_cf.AAC.16